MVLLASHIEKHPWLIYTSQFGQFLDQEVFVIPFWVWEELIRAINKSYWWKGQMHQFIVGLAKDQLQRIENDNSAFVYNNTEAFSLLVFKEVRMEISTDIGRLNRGVFEDSSSPRFTVVPNPSRGKIGIKFNNGIPDLENGNGVEWVIRDMFGRMVSQGFINGADDLIFDAGFISSGSYLIEIWNKNEFLGIQKFIILPN